MKKKQKKWWSDFAKNTGLPWMADHINDAQWEGISSFLKNIKGLLSNSPESLRIIIEGVWLILGTGIQWGHLSAC